MKGKKILICCNRTLNLGGIEKALTTFLKAFNTEDNEVVLVLHDDKGILYEELPLEAIKIIFTNDISSSELLRNDIKNLNISEIVKGVWNRIMLRIDKDWYASIMYTYRIIKRKLVFTDHYDCAISFTSDYSDLSMVLSANTDKRVSFVHGDATQELRAARLNDKLVQKIDKIYCVSEKAKELFLEVHPKCEKAMDVMYNVIIPEEIQKKAEESVDDIIMDGTFTLCTVGRLSPEKGQEMIPEIAHMLRDAGKTFRWYVIGDGNTRGAIQKEIIQRGLEDHVYLLGGKINPYPYMKNCDVYVQTSFSEAYCITVAEARVLCKPIIATDAPGLCEQIKNGVNGIITDEMTPKSIYKSISDLINNPVAVSKLVDGLQREAECENVTLQKIYDYIDES